MAVNPLNSKYNPRPMIFNPIKFVIFKTLLMYWFQSVLSHMTIISPPIAFVEVFESLPVLIALFLPVSPYNLKTEPIVLCFLDRFTHYLPLLYFHKLYDEIHHLNVFLIFRCPSGAFCTISKGFENLWGFATEIRIAR